MVPFAWVVITHALLIAGACVWIFFVNRRKQIDCSVCDLDMAKRCLYLAHKILTNYPNDFTLCELDAVLVRFLEGKYDHQR